jgi:hypothetical protein
MGSPYDNLRGHYFDMHPFEMFELLLMGTLKENLSND